MKKLCYEWNPEKNLSNQLFASLSRSERCLYREILDYMWMSDDQYRVEFNSDHLANELEIDTNELSALIEKLMKGNNPLLIEELCLEKCVFYLESPELHQQISQFQKLNKTIMDSMSPIRASGKSLVSKIKNDEAGNNEIEIMQSKPVNYQNWLPTYRYDTIGQKFLITEELKEHLDAICTTCNVEAELEKMFNWLNRYPEKRRALTDMKIFVCTWIRNADTRGSNSEIDFDELNNELEMLINNMAISA